MNILRLLHKYHVIPAMVYIYHAVAWLTRLDIPERVWKQPPTIYKYPLKYLLTNQLFRSIVVYTINILRLLHRYQAIPAIVYIPAAWLTSDILAQVSKQPPTLHTTL